jgi:hypothetical protein
MGYGGGVPFCGGRVSDTIRCTNCGKDIKGEPRRCAMFDRCIPAQNLEINKILGDKVYELLAQGKKVYSDQTRPLCWDCFNQNGGVCSHCDLDRALEEI